MNQPRILNIDVETAPNRVYSFGIWNVNIGVNQIEEPGRILCFAARWVGVGEEVIFKSEYHDGRLEMLEALWDLLDEADAVMGWNTQSFDVKWCNAEFLVEGYLPPTEYKHIDLLRVSRKNFKFPSNKLEYISKALDIGEKLKHYGFELWRDVMKGDPKAWSIMKRYNKKDILLVEEAYDILKPWINTPTLNFAQFKDVRSCPRCGCEDLTPEKKPRRTNVNQFKQHRCDRCGYVARERKADKTVSKPELI